MKLTGIILLLSLLLTSALAVAGIAEPGGQTAVASKNAAAFSLPARNMPLQRKLDFHVGNSFFRNPWVMAPSSTTARDGLGPLFNTNACQNCHIKDGRGHAPNPNLASQVSMLLRLSIAAKSLPPSQGVMPEPTYGEQLQDFAIAGMPPEGQIHITYTPVIETFADGEQITLRKPSVTISKLAYGPLHPNTQFSARIAPPMIGLGLLAAIPDATLHALAAEQRQSNTGISGKINKVWDHKAQQTVVGRFGWKAGQPSLEQQNAAAFLNDMGLTTSLFDLDICPPESEACLKAPTGGKPEVSDHILQQVTFYTENLAVPKRRNTQSPEIINGAKWFYAAGCENCHKTNLQTGSSRHPWLSQQTISPFTDLLRHEMGPGLADNRPEFLATGREWRTPPLWGIGLTHVVAGHANFLHDGRARTLMEAILWHGGEAESAKQFVQNLTKQQRQELIAFLESL